MQRAKKQGQTFHAPLNWQRRTPVPLRMLPQKKWPAASCVLMLHLLRSGASHPEQTSVLAGRLGSCLGCCWQPPSTGQRRRPLSDDSIPTCCRAGVPVPCALRNIRDQGFPCIHEALLSRGYSFKRFSHYILIRIIETTSSSIFASL